MHVKNTGSDLVVTCEEYFYSHGEEEEYKCVEKNIQ